MMSPDEEAKLRAAIRGAFEANGWEGDIGFAVPDGDAIAAEPFQVLEADDGVYVVTVPPEWEHAPYLQEIVQLMANQELLAHDAPGLPDIQSN